ncbi:hypothetical protein EDF76_1696 [Raoultella terrigena]|nr:hypothetical protein EDF76_1696 [Raoultella terrigena]
MLLTLVCPGWIDQSVKFNIVTDKKRLHGKGIQNGSAEPFWIPDYLGQLRRQRPCRYLFPVTATDFFTDARDHRMAQGSDRQVKSLAVVANQSHPFYINLVANVRQQVLSQYLSPILIAVFVNPNKASGTSIR